MPVVNRPGMDVPRDVRRRFTRRITRDGLRLKVELLGSLWLKAPFYGIMVSTSDGEHASYLLQRPYARCGPKEYDALAARIRTAPCAREGCRTPVLRDNPSNPDGLCRRHWKRQLDVDVARDRAAEKTRRAQADARARAKGLRYRAIVWLHRDGDDVYLTRYYKAKPTSEALARLARRRGSTVLDDVHVERI